MLELKEVKRNKNKNKPSTLRGTDRRGKKERKEEGNVLEEKMKKKKKENKKQEQTSNRKEKRKKKKTGNVSGLLIHVTSISLCYLNWV